MGFEEFLPESAKEENFDEEVIIESAEKNLEKITPNQIYDVITGKQHDWQTIIYELINSEQLDPWDIDVAVLTNRYFERILDLEPDPDFYVSSRVLLAAALLLRIKSEILLNYYIKSVDEILFGRKDAEKPTIGKIEIDESEIPLLIPKTPLSRLRKVTLPELMSALNKAINTETRRIKRELAIKRAHKLSQVDIPSFKRIDLKDRIKEFYARILTSLKKSSAISKEKHHNKVSYSNFVGKDKEQRLACFLPLLHLSNSKKLWLEQENHLDEIWIYLYNYFEDNKDKFSEEFLELAEEIIESEIEASENINEEISPLERARKRLEEKKRFEEDVRKEIEKELGGEAVYSEISSKPLLEISDSKISNGTEEIFEEIKELAKEVAEIEEQKKIDKLTGFSDE